MPKVKSSPITRSKSAAGEGTGNLREGPQHQCEFDPLPSTYVVVDTPRLALIDVSENYGTNTVGACSLMHTILLKDKASPGSSINTTLHQYNIITQATLFTCLSHKPQPTSTNCQGHTPTYQTSTKSDASKSDAMLQKMTSSSTISPHPPSPGAHLLSASTVCIRRHVTHCRELCYYY